MNLRSQIQKTRSELKALEGSYKDRVQMGSKDMNDYLELQYSSGVSNGLNFVFHAFENGMNETEFEELKKQLLHQENVN